MDTSPMITLFFQSQLHDRLALALMEKRREGGQFVEHYSPAEVKVDGALWRDDLLDLRSYLAVTYWSTRWCE